MDILTLIQKFLISIAVCGIFYLGGYNVGLREMDELRQESEKTLLDSQASSADYIANKVMNDYECQVELNGFTFEVCRQLGLIKTCH